MVNLDNRRVIGTAAALSIVLLAAATFSGKDSSASQFIAALGALGQIWVAAMMWHLSKQQFHFLQASTERALRTENYERRAALRQQWSEHTKQIGYKDLDEANAAKLFQLAGQIKLVFGAAEGDLAKRACTAADAAKKRARLLKAGGQKLDEDSEYRAQIDAYRAERKRTWAALTAKTALEGD